MHATTSLSTSRLTCLIFAFVSLPNKISQFLQLITSYKAIQMRQSLNTTSYEAIRVKQSLNTTYNKLQDKSSKTIRLLAP